MADAEPKSEQEATQPAKSKTSEPEVAQSMVEEEMAKILEVINELKNTPTYDTAEEKKQDELIKYFETFYSQLAQISKESNDFVLLKKADVLGFLDYIETELDQAKSRGTTLESETKRQEQIKQEPQITNVIEEEVDYNWVMNRLNQMKENFVKSQSDPNEIMQVIQYLTKELQDATTKLENPKLFPLFEDSNNLNVLSNMTYQGLREALAHNDFEQLEDSPWPTAILNKGNSMGHAQLRPLVLENEALMPPDKFEAWVKMMWKQQKELSDLDADALDLLSHTWLQQARSPKDYALADIDQFLELRGLKPKQNGQGQRGGYEPEQRAEMLHALSHIQNIWINMGEVEIYEEGAKGRSRKASKRSIQSRAFIITDRMGQMSTNGYLDVEKFIFQPGHLFAQFLYGAGRQTALLSAKAVQYDPYRQKWEKRLARYLSWQWRVQAKHGNYTRPYRVSTLLEASGEKIKVRRPERTRDRLEKALDRLQEDEVIAHWQYERWDEKIAEQYGWSQVWLQSTISIEPPDIISDSYKALEQVEDKPKSQKAKPSSLPKTSTEPPDIISDSYKTFEQVEDKPKSQKAKPSSLPKTSTEPKTLGWLIQQRRKTLRLSQTEAAEEMGIAQSYLSKLERDQLNPAPDLQKRIYKWLNTSPLV